VLKNEICDVEGTVAEEVFEQGRGWLDYRISGDMQGVWGVQPQLTTLKLFSFTASKHLSLN